MKKPTISHRLFVSLYRQKCKDMNKDTQEIWETIPGHSKYMVSQSGIIKSFYYPNKPKILKQSISKKGYHNINIESDDKSKTSFRVHRIVAMTFIPNPENKLFVNHKDGNKSNNHVDNLEWCTHSENVRHAHANNLVKRHTITLNTETGIYYDTIKEAALTYNLNVKKLTNMLCGWQINTSKFIAIR